MTLSLRLTDLRSGWLGARDAERNAHPYGPEQQKAKELLVGFVANKLPPNLIASFDLIYLHNLRSYNNKRSADPTAPRSKISRADIFNIAVGQKSGVTYTFIAHDGTPAKGVACDGMDRPRRAFLDCGSSGTCIIGCDLSVARHNNWRLPTAASAQQGIPK